jgi:acetoin utilization protein AcuB
VLVGEHMSQPVITVTPDTPMQEALRLMQENRIRRLPVIDKRGKLVGIVSEREILHASPSDATSLSVWEINYLLSKITIEKIMSRDVISVSENTPLEEAACIMADRKVGGLPVMRQDKVVGIITETDLFKVFIEALGARRSGVRLTVKIPNVPGELARLAQKISELGGNIIALVTLENEITIKVSGVNKAELSQAVVPLVEKLVDVREVEDSSCVI